MCDSKGVINHKRENLTPEKLDFIAQTDISTLEQALEGADDVLLVCLKEML